MLIKILWWVFWFVSAVLSTVYLRFPKESKIRHSKAIETALAIGSIVVLCGTVILGMAMRGAVAIEAGGFPDNCLDFAAYMIVYEYLM